MTHEHVECPTVAHCVRLEDGQCERYMWHGVWAVTKKPTRLWLRCVWLLIEFVNSAWLYIVISGSAKVPSGYVEQNVMLLQLGLLQFNTGLFPQLMVNLSPFLRKPPLPSRASFLGTWWFYPTQIQMCRRKSTNGWSMRLYLFSFCILYSERLRSNVLTENLLERDLKIVLPTASDYLCPKSPEKGKRLKPQQKWLNSFINAYIRSCLHHYAIVAWLVYALFLMLQDIHFHL